MHPPAPARGVGRALQRSHPLCRRHLEGTGAGTECAALTNETVNGLRVTNQRMTLKPDVQNSEDELERLVHYFQ